jgi:hypothetical protein
VSAVNEFGQSEPLKAETPIIAKMPFGMISVTIFIHFNFHFLSLKYFAGYFYYANYRFFFIIISFEIQNVGQT